MTPFTWQDFSRFMGRQVRRKEISFTGDLWTVYGCNDKQVFLMEVDGPGRLGKFYDTMMEDWVFADGAAFAQEGKPQASEKVRREDKLFAFVVEHKTACYRAFKQGITHSDFKTEEGRKLVEMAREHVGYSPNTWSGDIYVFIWNTFKSITQ